MSHSEFINRGCDALRVKVKKKRTFYYSRLQKSGFLTLQDCVTQLVPAVLFHVTYTYLTWNFMSMTLSCSFIIQCSIHAT